jgi:hypothetical protein
MEQFVLRKPGAAKSRPKIKSAARRAGENTGRKNQNSPAERGKFVLYRGVQALGKTIDRWFSNKGTLSSGVGGTIAISSISFADIVTAVGTEWTNFSQEFQQFRMNEVQVRFIPATVNATSVTGPYQGAMEICPWQQLRITSVTSVDQSVELSTFSTLEEENFRFQPKMPNDKLWNAVGVAIPVDRDFGFAYASYGATLAANSIIYNILQRVHATFRVPQ